MKFNNIRVYNFEYAIHGMRNPLESWAKSDTETGICRVDSFNEVAKHHLNKWGITNPTEDDIIIALNDIISYNDGEYATFISIGPQDMKLMKNLISGGTEHRKFLRQIFLTVDITAPLYWWKEFDTYKVGTTANSTSTMHKLASTPITKECFEIGDYDDSLSLIDDVNLGLRVDCFIDDLEQLRQKYLMTKDKKYWKELIRWLPESWLQTRTVTLNYENIRTMINQRKNHKLNEWSGQENPQLSNFITFAMQLPYAKDLLVD